MTFFLVIVYHSLTAELLPPDVSIVKTPHEACEIKRRAHKDDVTEVLSFMVSYSGSIDPRSKPITLVCEGAK